MLLFNRSNYDVADIGIPPAGTSENANAHNLLRAGVVGNLEVTLLLYHSVCLLTVTKKLFSLLDDLNYAPSLVLGHRAGLHDEDTVADSAGVVLIMSLELDGAVNDLLVKRMLYPILDGDDNSLIHLIAGHNANASFLRFLSISVDLPFITNWRREARYHAELS